MQARDSIERRCLDGEQIFKTQDFKNFAGIMPSQIQRFENLGTIKTARRDSKGRSFWNCEEMIAALKKIEDFAQEVSR